jgi:hypothetical protein
VNADDVVRADVDVEVFGLEVVGIGRRVTEADCAQHDEQKSIVGSIFTRLLGLSVSSMVSGWNLNSFSSTACW